MNTPFASSPRGTPRSTAAPERRLIAAFVGVLLLSTWTLPARELRALVVGIDHYKVFGELKYSTADAKAVAEALVTKGRCAPANVTLLTDTALAAAQRPTLARLQEEVERLAAAGAEGDTLLLFFSGHGISAGTKGDAYLVPMEGLAQGTLSLRWIKETLGNSKATVVLMLDLSRKGSTAQGVARMAPELATARFLIITSTSEPDEFSFDDDAAGHTLFTRAFLDFTDRWPGKTRVSVADLYRALADRINELTFQSARKQKPLLAGAEPESVVFFLPTGGEASGGGVEAENAHGPVQGRLWRVPGPDLELVPVAPGPFKMGSKQGDADEANVHQATISKGFWIGKYEVTQAEYTAVMGVNPSRTKGPRLPVTKVDWRNATAFCQRLTDSERAANRLPAGYAYRLPTEAEWEYAARAGTETEYCFGDDQKELSHYGNFNPVDPRTGKRLPAEVMPDDGIDGPAKAGSFKPNAWGICDMHGNVWEWCLDYYEPYPARDVTDYAGPENGFFHTARGGGWADAAVHCRSASRAAATAEYVSNGLGFRVVLGPDIAAHVPAPALMPEFKP